MGELLAAKCSNEPPTAKLLLSRKNEGDASPRGDSVPLFNRGDLRGETSRETAREETREEIKPGIDVNMPESVIPAGPLGLFFPLVGAEDGRSGELEPDHASEPNIISSRGGAADEEAPCTVFASAAAATLLR